MIVNYVAISLGPSLITSNWSVELFGGYVMFAWQPFSVVFELGLAYISFLFSCLNHHNSIRIVNLVWFSLQQILLWLAVILATWT